MPHYADAYEELQGLSEETSVRRDVALAAQRKTTIDQKLLAVATIAASPDGLLDEDWTGLFPLVDDGEAPGVAQNITPEPIIEGIAVQWDTPPGLDRVKAAEVRITPEGGSSAVVKAAKSTGHTFLGLSGAIEYEIEVDLIDLFGAHSGWSPGVFATPTSTAIDSIDLDAIEIAGSLGWDNLEPLTDPNKMGDDVVVARAMAAQDAALLNLWVQDAAIVSAKIHQLVADKIVGGTISTTDIFVASTLNLAAGGELLAGEGTRLDVGGMAMLPAPDYNVPSVDRDQKISPLGGDWASMAFYDDATPNTRGVVLRADGDVDVRKGAVALHATKNGVLSATGSARVEVLSKSSGNGQVDVYRDLWVQHDVTADDFLLRGGGSLSSVKATANGAIQDEDDSVKDNNLATNYIEDKDNSVQNSNLAGGPFLKDSDNSVSNANLATRYVKFSEIGQDKDHYLIWIG